MPLSPYLFTVIMSCLFHDIHHRDHLRTREHRIEGTTHDQVLYADDTICMSENEETMTRLIQAIEQEGATYGLRLNKKSVNTFTSVKPKKSNSWMEAQCHTNQTSNILAAI